MADIPSIVTNAGRNSSLLDISPEGDIHIQHFRRNPLEEARKVQILKDLRTTRSRRILWVDDPYPFATYLHLLPYGEVLEAQRATPCSYRN